MTSRKVLLPAIAGIVLGIALVAIVTTSLSIPAAGGEAQPISLMETLQHAEQADPEFASCVNLLKGEGMAQVMDVDAACGDLYTATTCDIGCHTAAANLAATMGCCWKPLIAGFARVQQSAAHAWHGWGYAMENVCGVSISGTCEAAKREKRLAKDTAAANNAVSSAQSVLQQAKEQQRAAELAQQRALKAQAQAKKLQKEMKKEADQFHKLRRRFRVSRADSVRAVVVERMVHNSVKKDLASAWGIHKQVQRDRVLANKVAAGTQIQQANARALLKSAHAAKKSVLAMRSMAHKAKMAAFRLHKIALKDLLAAKKVRKLAKIERDLAKKAGKDVKKSMQQSAKIIATSAKEQAKAKKLWGALKNEQGAYNAEKSQAEQGVDDEEAIEKKMEAEIEEAEGKFADFEKDEDAAEAAVLHAEELAQRAAQISDASENLLSATQLQQEHIDKERGWITQQEAQMMAGRRGIASMEGELDVLKSKYFQLRRAISGLAHAVPRHVIVRRDQQEQQQQPAQTHEIYRRKIVQEQTYPPQTYYGDLPIAPRRRRTTTYEQYERHRLYPQQYPDQYPTVAYAGQPLAHIIVPLPPHTHLHVASFQQQQQDAQPQQQQLVEY